MADSSLQHYRQLASECLDDGREEAGLIYAEFACALSHGNGLDVMKLARLLRARGEYSRAVHRLEQASEDAGLTGIHPLGIEARVLLCRCLERQARWGELLEASQAVLQVGGRDDGELLHSHDPEAIRLRRLAGFGGQDPIMPGQVLRTASPSARAVSGYDDSDWTPAGARTGTASISTDMGDFQAASDGVRAKKSMARAGEGVDEGGAIRGSTRHEDEDEDGDEDEDELCRAACATSLVLAHAMEAVVRADASLAETRRKDQGTRATIGASTGVESQLRDEEEDEDEDEDKGTGFIDWGGRQFRSVGAAAAASRRNIASLCYLQGVALGKRGDSEGSSAWLKASLAVEPTHLESVVLLAEGFLLPPRGASNLSKAAFIAAGIKMDRDVDVDVGSNPVTSPGADIALQHRSSQDAPDPQTGGRPGWSEEGEGKQQEGGEEAESSQRQMREEPKHAIPHTQPQSQPALPRAAAHFVEASVHAGRATGFGIEAAEALGALHDGALRSCAPVRALLAQYALEVMDVHRAGEHAEQAVLADPMHREGAAVYCEALAAGGLVERLHSIAVLRGRLAPSDPVTHETIGAYYLTSNDPSMAAASLRDSLRADGSRPRVWVLLGRALSSKGETEQAQAAFRAASRLAPQWHVPLLSLAKEAVAVRSDGLAAVFLQRARRMGPMDPACHHESAVLAFRHKRPRQALAHIRVALGLLDPLSPRLRSPWAKTYVLAGQCLRATGRLHAALVVLQYALGLVRRHGALAGQAAGLMQMGHGPEGAGLVEEMVVAGDALAARRAASALVLRGAPTGNTSGGASSDVTQRADIMCRIGDVLLMLGRPRDAAAVLHGAIALDPASPLARVLLRKAMLRLHGDEDGGVRHADREFDSSLRTAEEALGASAADAASELGSGPLGPRHASEAAASGSKASEAVRAGASGTSWPKSVDIDRELFLYSLVQQELRAEEQGKMASGAGTSASQRASAMKGKGTRGVGVRAMGLVDGGATSNGGNAHRDGMHAILDEIESSMRASRTRHRTPVAGVTQGRRGKVGKPVPPGFGDSGNSSGIAGRGRGSESGAMGAKSSPDGSGDNSPVGSAADTGTGAYGAGQDDDDEDEDAFLEQLRSSRALALGTPGPGPESAVRGGRLSFGLGLSALQGAASGLEDSLVGATRVQVGDVAGGRANTDARHQTRGYDEDIHDGDDDDDDFESMDMSEEDGEDEDEDEDEQRGEGSRSRRSSVEVGIANSGSRAQARAIRIWGVAQPPRTPGLAVGDLGPRGVPVGGLAGVSAIGADSSGDMSFSGVSGVSEFSPGQARME